MTKYRKWLLGILQLHNCYEKCGRKSVNKSWKIKRKAALEEWFGSLSLCIMEDILYEGFYFNIMILQLLFYKFCKFHCMLSIAMNAYRIGPQQYIHPLA